MSVLDELYDVKDALISILKVLEENKEKLDRLLASKGDKELIEAFEPKPKKELLVTEKVIVKGGRTIPGKGQGQYEWFKVNGLPGVKVRKCSNEGCPYFLKYSEEKGKYEHWKYDPNTKEGGFVQDRCDYYLPEGIS